MHKTLNSGHHMPLLGLGTFQGAYSYEANNQITQAAVYEAIRAGFRMLDTAYLYNTEEGVGQGIKRAIGEGLVKRDELFVVTKLWSTHHQRGDVKLELAESLRRLGLTYVDAYLIHWPCALKRVSNFESGAFCPKDGDGNIIFDDSIDYLETWKGMEDCVASGLVRSIGISNFNIEQIKRLLSNCNIPPACIQAEIHPYHSNDELVQFCKTKDIAVVAYSPLAKGFSKPGVKDEDPNVFTDPVITRIAKDKEKTNAQIVLRFLTQRGLCIVPKSVTASRLRENAKMFEFSLTNEEMAALEKLNRDYRIVVIDWLRPSRYYPFKPDSV